MSVATRNSLTGKRFRLDNEILAVTTMDGARRIFKVPKGSVVNVTGGPPLDDGPMVDVHFGGQTLMMFAEDIRTRGKEV